MYRGDDYVRPEAAAVLSDPPALLFDAPFGTGDFEIVLRLTILLVLGRIEEREMLADDLVRPVAHDALRPGVPGANIPRWAEHEHRVIRDVADEKGQLLRSACEVDRGACHFRDCNRMPFACQSLARGTPACARDRFTQC